MKEAQKHEQFGMPEASQPLTLGFDDLLSSGNIRDLQEAGYGVTVGIVRAGSRRQTGWELGGGQGHGEEREQDWGHHLGTQGWLYYTVAQSIFTDSTANSIIQPT